MRSLITSVRSEVLGGHAHISVWSRGGKSGTLVVDAPDALSLCRRLIPCGRDHIDIGGRYSRWTEEDSEQGAAP